MAHFTRQSLYDLVWSKPTRTIAAEIGVSDVWLAKACKAADIPVPERGYWARKQAGKHTITRKLPPRFPGASDEIDVGGGGRNFWGSVSREEILNDPIPPVPTFAEDLSDVEARVRKMLGKVSCPRQITQPHKLIAVLLERDEKRRAEYAALPVSFYSPRFDNPSERRRLRIWNAIFLAVQRIGCKVSMSTSQYADSREADIRVGDTSVPFKLEPAKTKSRGAPDAKGTEVLRLSIGSRHSTAAPVKAWEDTAEHALEDLVTDIVIEIVIIAERWYREGRVRNREWRIQRKAEVEAEIRREKAEAEKQARELRAKQAKERIERLVGEAHALDQSNTIRTYVSAVQSRAAELPVTACDLERWIAWALAEADRIDPVKNGAVQAAITALAEAHIQNAESPA